MFKDATQTMTQSKGFLASLDDLTVIRITGADAIEFLHAQLSNDISGMGSDHARLAAYCNPKGRMLGNLVLWRETAAPDSPFLALAKADATEAMLKRLRMFVLRAKVNFEMASLKVYGVSQAVPTAPEGGDTAWALERQGERVLITAPTGSDTLRRTWLVAGPESAPSSLAAELGLDLGNRAAWQAQDIQAGLGWVEQSNVELFIPQSLNYDLNGGVSFTKGCYPGQEVVARAHYRGAVKRRGMSAVCRLPDGQALQAGMDVFDAGRPNAPAGRIINAAGLKAESGQDNTWHLFVEINLNDVGQVDFRALSAEGPAIVLQPLPYSLEPGGGQ